MEGSGIIALSREGFLLENLPIQSVYDSNTGRTTSVLKRQLGLIESFKGIIFVKIAIGKHRRIALAQDGRLYEWSSTGFNVYELDFFPYHDVETEDKTVTDILCTVKYPMVLTKGGKVFISLHHEESVSTTCVKYDKLKIFGENLRSEKIVELSVGCNYVFALSDKGEIFKWNILHGFHVLPQRVDYKCHMFQTNGKRIWASHSKEMLLILLETGMIICIHFLGNGEVLSKSITPSWSDYQFLNACGVPFKGCLYNDVKVKDVEVLKGKWMINLEATFDVKEGSDLIIEVEGKPIHCHKCIVSGQCVFLKKWIMNESLKENTPGTLRLCLTTFKYETVYAILKYFYTGRLEFHSFNIALELMELTEMWLEEDIQKYCVGQAIEWLSLDNVHLAKEKADALLDSRESEALKDLEEACLFLNPDLN